MSSRLCALPVAAAVLLSTAPAADSSREIDNVAAFARLYGVVRFFYPSDAAADLDWNRLAVHGVTSVRPAGTASELETALRKLVAPLGPGLEIGASLAPPTVAPATAEPLVAWRYLGAGFSTMGGAYRAKRTHRAPASPAEGFVTLMQTAPGAPLRGKSIRLRAQARATAAPVASGGALWLRVDRPNQVMGFFDNMANRLIREPEWRSYSVEGPVADDAENVAFGVMAVGAVTADFDGVELAAKGVTGDWQPVAVPDAGFEAAEGEKGGWFRTGTGNAVPSRPTGVAPQGRQYARIAPPPAGSADIELFPEGAPTPGAHVDIELGSGLRARVPLVLTDSEARPDPQRQADLDALRAALAAVPGPAAAPGLDERLADVVVAWSVFRHFYPYWAEAGVDWDARLQPQLEIARAADTREAQRNALRSLVADARDGHGSVSDTLDRTERGELPVRLEVVEGRLVVTSSAVPEEAPVGAVVATMDGAPATDRLARALCLASGTRQWRRVAGTWPLMTGPKGAAVTFGLDTGAGSREVELAYGTPAPPVKRPGPVAELDPGLWYVDLTRTKMAEVEPRLAALAAARAVVFDVRGYPTDAGFGILPHLLRAPESTRWMHVAKIVGPFYETAGWQDLGWDVKPADPRLAGEAVFLTDGRAISYAESVMGYVADLGLGTIVGGTTAGTNGNVASFVTPGGFSVSFTGMRVTRHDGRSPHHLVGVKPDVAVAPTLEGLRTGRDEVLERGLAIARAGAEGPLAPFAARWEEPEGGDADLSFLLDPPAGGRGFVSVRDGHLATPDGKRVRLWGVNLTGAAGLPSKADAPRLAAILARHGLNAVRFHFLDLPAPRGLVDAARDDTRALDPASLDRLDFFVAELKKRGIWTNLNLNVGRRYKGGDGVRDFERLGFAKGLTHFDERLVELQKEYARQLLTHRNPYTGAEYRHEPAVAIVEMVNENSLVESWFSDRLLGKATQVDPGTWPDVTESYARDLTGRYQAWLRERLSPEEVVRLREEAGVGPGADVPRLTRDAFARASALRFRTEAAFYVSLEERFFRGMASFLRDELGVRALLVGTADHNHGRSGYPLLRSTSALDVVDGHVYWQHPDYLEGRAASGQSLFRIPNTPMVDDPLHSTVVQLARSAVAGKPYTVSEVNHPFPNEYAAEGIPILAAYAALQDWDGVFLYTFEHAAPPDWEERVRGHFDLRPDPVKMAGVAAGALLFLRPDVRAAASAHLRSYSAEEVLESLRLPGSGFPFFTPGFDLSIPLRRKARIRGFAGGASDTSAPASPGRVVSDTGELAWRARDGDAGGLVTVETDRTEALVGFEGSRNAALRHLQADVRNPFAALTLSALDGEPIARSARLLLTAGARTANTGMKWNAAHTGLDDWGSAPLRIETVRGRVTLRGLAGAKRVVVTALSPDGWKTKAATPAVASGDGWRFDLGATPTVWYVVDVER